MSKATYLYPRATGSAHSNPDYVKVTSVAYQAEGVMVDLVKNGESVTRFYPYTSINYIESREV